MLMTGSNRKNFAESPVWHICTDGPLLVARIEPNPDPDDIARDRVVAWPVALKDADTTPERLLKIVQAHHRYIEYDEPPKKWDILFDRATTVPPFLITMPTAIDTVTSEECYGLLSTTAPAIWFPLDGERNDSNPFDIGSGDRITFGHTIPHRIQEEIALQAGAWLDTLD